MVSPKKSNVRIIGKMLMFIAVLSYFLYHAMSGERGFLALATISQQIEHSRKELELLQSRRELLEHRTNLMRDESLDLDLLEEEVKKNLGFAEEDEVIFSR